jgi:hypothetical protein
VLVTAADMLAAAPVFCYRHYSIACKVQTSKYYDSSCRSPAAVAHGTTACLCRSIHKHSKGLWSFITSAAAGFLTKATPLNKLYRQSLNTLALSAAGMPRHCTAAASTRMQLVNCSRHAASVRGGTSAMYLNATPADATEHTCGDMRKGRSRLQGQGQDRCVSCWPYSKVEAADNVCKRWQYWINSPEYKLSETRKQQRATTAEDTC